ncbi:hypothetical protein CGLO_05648 [Colletotrichum gloeosporioides Cg-14]|uniref:Uncharacterized protein n=1 Tax=Colletotrichum gloeosporioides (strain Cg-14) TaxID=1237896 RepID=T0KR26_COLGC|nr:hypothetical protein CGLO_05648 [Colletotrichum gloeosporioides Cg-14]
MAAGRQSSGYSLEEVFLF